MNASPQILVEPIIPAITPLDRTGVNVQSDLLLILVNRTHLIQIVSVRSKVVLQRNFRKCDLVEPVHMIILYFLTSEYSPFDQYEFVQVSLFNALILPKKKKKIKNCLEERGLLP